MAADNESANRVAAERRLGFVVTAFRGIKPPEDTAASCAARGASTIGRAQMGSALLGRRAGGWVRWFFSGIWLVYLISPVSDLFGKGHGPLWIAGGVTLAVVFCVLYITVLATWESYPKRAHIGLAVIVALSVTACLVYGGEWTSMWIYVSAATGFVFPGRRRALIAVAVSGACYALLAWISHVSATNLVVELLPVLLIGWAMVGFRLQLVLMFELRQARETVAKLAANEERLRLARDMHDLTGQSLSLITLKSELAVKRLAQLPPSAELEAVLSEVSDIGRVSRQTLHDIREAVSGYRRPTLAVEIITARTSLEAAGIHLDDDPALMVRSGTFDPEAEAVLAWCLREAATNVIRHSGAQHCRIRLTERGQELSLEVSDDGRGLTGECPDAAPASSGGSGSPASADGLEDPAATTQAQPSGSGLHNMSERLSAVAGRFSVRSTDRDGRGFRLVATVPSSPAPATTRASGPQPGTASEPQPGADSRPPGADSETQPKAATPPQAAAPANANVRS